LYDDDKYQVLADTVGPERIVFILDDLPENVERARDLELPAWLMRRPHNAAVPHPNVCTSMKQALGTALLAIGEFNHGS